MVNSPPEEMDWQKLSVTAGNLPSGCFGIPSVEFLHTKSVGKISEARRSISDECQTQEICLWSVVEQNRKDEKGSRIEKRRTPDSYFVSRLTRPHRFSKPIIFIHVKWHQASTPDVPHENAISNLINNDFVLARLALLSVR